MASERPRVSEVVVVAGGVDEVARFFVEEPRHVEEDADDEDGHQGRDGERPADDLTSPQRVTDGDVATDGHR